VVFQRLETGSEKFPMPGKTRKYFSNHWKSESQEEPTKARVKSGVSNALFEIAFKAKAKGKRVSIF